MGSDAKGWIVVSLGGSIIVPKAGIDVPFLREFKALAERLLADGYRLMIVTGGGKTCREYQQAVRDIVKVPDYELDWLGIHSTRLNAHLLRTLFHDIAEAAIVINPEEDHLPVGAKLIIGAGWKPGFSSDVDAVVLAKRLGAKRLINISNVTHVYSEDPRVNPAAARYDELGWAQMRSIVGDEWRPGLNAPFDPVAARMCQELGLEVDIVAGSDIPNIERALRGETFVGTRIHG